MTRAFRSLSVVGLVQSVASSAHAQTGNGYDLTWNSIDGGGGTSAGGDFELSGTAGQPDAGEMSDGGFALSALCNRSGSPSPHGQSHGAPNPESEHDATLVKERVMRARGFSLPYSGSRGTITKR